MLITTVYCLYFIISYLFEFTHCIAVAVWIVRGYVRIVVYVCLWQFNDKKLTFSICAPFQNRLFDRFILWKNANGNTFDSNYNRHNTYLFVLLSDKSLCVGLQHHPNMTHTTTRLMRMNSYRYKIGSILRNA